VKEERNILQIIKRRKAKWIGHMLHRNCLLDEEEDISSYCYWMTLRKRQDIFN